MAESSSKGCDRIVRGVRVFVVRYAGIADEPCQGIKDLIRFPSGNHGLVDEVTNAILKCFFAIEVPVVGGRAWAFHHAKTPSAEDWLPAPSALSLMHGMDS